MRPNSANNFPGTRRGRIQTLEESYQAAHFRAGSPAPGRIARSMLLGSFRLIRVESVEAPGKYKTWRLKGDLFFRELPGPRLRFHIEMRLFAWDEQRGKVHFHIVRSGERIYESPLFEIQIPEAEALKDVPFACDLDDLVFDQAGFYSIEALLDDQRLCSMPFSATLRR